MKVLDILGSVNTKLSVRTSTINAQVLAHNDGWWGAPAGMFVGTQTAHPLSFGTNHETRMTIDDSGRVGIGTANPAAILDVAIPLNGLVRLGKLGTASEVQFTDGRIRSEGAKFQILGQQPTGLSVPITFGQSANDFDMTIQTNGNVGIGSTNPTDKLFVAGNIRATGSITPGSSRELKENIADLSLQEAVSALKGLNPVKYNYKADEQKDLHTGFIAEEVPELLATPDRKGVNPMDVIAVLTKVMQECLLRQR